MTEPARKKFWTRAEWLLAVAITAIIIFLHFFLWRYAGGFCGDEVGTINLSGNHSLPAMVHDFFQVLTPCGALTDGMAILVKQKRGKNCCIRNSLVVPPPICTMAAHDIA